MADEETPTPRESEETPSTDAASPNDAAPESDAYSETETELLARLERELGDGIIEHADSFGTLMVRVRPDTWRRAAEVARDALECDYLSFISGLDWMPAPKEGDEDTSDTSAPVQPREMTFGTTGSAGRFQVFAHVQSTAKHWGVTFKTDVDEDTPSATSWASVYPGADWHERECWEMYGFDFDGHPGLRHLYLPGEFEGHPLRKDFPLLARVVKPWPGLVDVEGMPEDPALAAESAGASEPIE